MSSDWKKLRVVVEVPARGDFTEKDLRYIVDQLVSGSRIKVQLRPGQRPSLGRTLVKEYGKVRTAEERGPRTVSQRLDRLEKEVLDLRDPHKQAGYD